MDLFRVSNFARPVKCLFLFNRGASARPGATSFALEGYYGKTTETLSKSLTVCNPGPGQGIPVYPG